MNKYINNLFVLYLTARISLTCGYRIYLKEILFKSPIIQGLCPAGHGRIEVWKLHISKLLQIVKLLVYGSTTKTSI